VLRPQKPDLNRRSRRRGFSLIELMLSVTLGSMLVIGLAQSTTVFAGSSSDLRATATTVEAEQSVSRVAQDVRNAWYVEKPSSTKLELADPYGNETQVYLESGQLKVKRPDGTVGVLIDGVTSVQFDVSTTQRLREATPTSAYGVVDTNSEPAGTADVLSLSDGDSVSVAFQVPVEAPDAFDTVTGIDEQVLAADLASFVPKLAYDAVTPLPVTPKRECVWNNGDGTYTGWFGYDNPNPFPVTIAKGTDNYMSPSPLDKGQPTVFQPGRNYYVFSVTFHHSDPKQRWYINGNGAFVYWCSPACATPAGG
jgi:prepilin-type N-terminal cleavage/methylation domain-containing protein